MELPPPTGPAFARHLGRLLDEEPRLRGIFVRASGAYESAPYQRAYHRAEIRLVGYDLPEHTLHLLRAGVLDFLRSRNPRKQGYRGLYALADQLVLEREGAPRKYLPLAIVTKENVQCFV